MPELKLEVGHVYETKDGHRVRIVYEDCDNSLLIIGLIRESGYERPLSFTRERYCNESSMYNLVREVTG